MLLMVDDMEKTVERLRSLNPMISDICQISGSAGMSIGVAHCGEVIRLANIGYRDVERQIPPDSDTVYPIAL